MNGDDDLDTFQPSWMDDGLGLQGQQDSPPYQEDTDDWITDVRSFLNDQGDDGGTGGAGGSGCLSDAGDPPGSGTYVLGSVDGTCQWIDTTDCSMM